MVPDPSQIPGFAGLTDTTGVVFTVIPIELIPEQPAVVPVTEYVVVEDGETTIEEVVAPVDQRYDEAPVAVSVVDWPEQIVLCEALKLTVMLDVTNAVAITRELLATRSGDFTTRS